MKLAIVIPAYNAGKTIERVFSRIPSSVFSRRPAFIAINDGSTDDTAEALVRLAGSYPDLVVIEHHRNLGYARAQKSGFKMALEKGADVVALLHSDGQYAPEEMPELLQPLTEGSADVVVGSRILGGRALEGGMPFYKYIGNIVISKVENLCFGLNFTEYHSGYMLYSRHTLETIDFMRLSDTFHFDGEMLLMAGKKNLRVIEKPISTRYADEESHLHPLKYCFDIGMIVLRYFAGKYNF